MLSDFAYVPLKQKTESPIQLETEWPWGGVLVSARSAVDDPRGSRRELEPYGKRRVF